MVCLDTTFIIDLIKGKDEITTLENQLYEKNEQLATTAPTVIEIIRGIHLKNITIKENEKRKIEELLSSIEILTLDKESAKGAGKIHANLINRGEDIGLSDVMIASICIQNNETLLTRNIKHFERIKDLKIESY